MYDSGHTAVSPARLFRCERVVHWHLADTAADEVTDVSQHTVAEPAEAVRSIRRAVRDLACVLPPAERDQALNWVDGGGWIGALGALYRGESCGFSLNHRGRRIEWTVHPYLGFRVDTGDLLPVVRPHG
ncbi:hypothetical protein [Streptomyces sp. NPDC014734]|uniref:hypothetical protein n=1 Tax=Streptomyces sp. NPDC014734 TaxID=3364886 RepID=UPI0036FAB811